MCVCMCVCVCMRVCVRARVCMCTCVCLFAGTNLSNFGLPAFLLAFCCSVTCLAQLMLLTVHMVELNFISSHTHTLSPPPPPPPLLLPACLQHCGACGGTAAATGARGRRAGGGTAHRDPAQWGWRVPAGEWPADTLACLCVCVCVCMCGVGGWVGVSVGVGVNVNVVLLVNICAS